MTLIAKYIRFQYPPFTLNARRNKSPSEITLRGRLHVEKPAEQHPGSTRISLPPTTTYMGNFILRNLLMCAVNRLFNYLIYSSTTDPVVNVFGACFCRRY